MPDKGKKRNYDTIWKDIKKRVNTFFDTFPVTIGGDYESDVPKVKDPGVGNYVKNLFEDALSHRNTSFAQTKDSRFNKSDPMEFFRELIKIEGGNHWDVWGHRADGIEEQWRQEETDDETADQIRARNAWLNGNWHDIEVSPNIGYLDQVLQQEREDTKWGKNIRKCTKTMQFFGKVYVESRLDKSKDPRGQANERVRIPGSTLLSPFSEGKERADGCWHVVFADTVNKQWVRKNYPDFDITKLVAITGTDLKQITVTNTTETSPTYTHTSMYPMLRVYLDDDTLEKAKFDQEEFDTRLGDLLAGIPVEPEVERDDHQLWIEAWRDYAQGMVDLAHPPDEPEQLLSLAEEETLAVTLELIEDQIRQHQAAEEKKELAGGKRAKYPYGRYIVTINGEVAEDGPSQYHFDWRHLLHEGYNEEVPGRDDGRGDIEILRNVQKTLDRALSRYADNVILHGNNKPWFHESEKQLVEQNYTNDPRKPGYYKVKPPVFPNTPRGQDNLELWKLNKENARRKLGVSDVTFGESPTKQASGDLAEILTQNQSVVITGEANQNLDDMVKEMIETRIMIWKQFYTEPRLYVINGQEVPLTLSKILKTRIIEEDGAQVEKPIKSFQVTVRPGSNQPQKWERAVSLMMSLVQVVGIDGMPVVDPAVLRDLVSERYPQVNDPKYRQLSEATMIGMQVLEAQKMQAEAKAKAEQQDADALKGQLKNKGMKILMGGGGNGSSQTQSMEG